MSSGKAVLRRDSRKQAPRPNNEERQGQPDQDLSSVHHSEQAGVHDAQQRLRSSAVVIRPVAAAYHATRPTSARQNRLQARLLQGSVSGITIPNKMPHKCSHTRIRPARKRAAGARSGLRASRLLVNASRRPPGPGHARFVSVPIALIKLPLPPKFQHVYNDPYLSLRALTSPFARCEKRQ